MMPKKNWFLYTFVLLVLLLLLWVVTVFPEGYRFMFQTFLGNVVLFVLVALLLSRHLAAGFLVGLLVLLLWASSHVKKEGFSGAYPPSLLRAFQAYQQTFLPTYIYDLERLQEQASPAEVEHLVRTRRWPWSPEVTKIYKNKIRQSTFLSVDPEEALQNAQQVYNQSAMVDLLAANTHEASFLWKGKEMEDGSRVQCDPWTERLVRSTPAGISGIWGNTLERKRELKDRNLEKEIPGFHFVRGVCNPCQPDSCPFTLSSAPVSPIWKWKWGL
jgi:hypothetical protein